MIRLLKISFQENKRSFAIGAVGVAVGAFMIVFFLGLVASIRATVETKIFPEESIEVTESRSEVLDTVSLISGKKGSSGAIDSKKLERIVSIEGVDAVYPRLRFMFPAKAYGGKELFGFEGGTDIVGDGIPTQLVEKEKIRNIFKDYYPLDSASSCRSDNDCSKSECCHIEEGQGSGVCRHPVPFIVSNRLLEIYNTVIAPAHNLVRLPEWTVNKARGMRLNVIAGRSYQSKANKGIPEKVCVAFAGISRQSIDIGITVPLAYAERWNKKYAGDFHGKSYSSAVLKIGHKQSLGIIIQKLKENGFAVVSKGQEEMGFFIGILNGIFIVIAILMVFVSSMGISHIFYGIVVERKREIGLMRALGASKKLIMRLYLLQGSIVGLMGGAAGIVVAVAMSYIANFIAGNYLPDFPFKPESFFQFETWILAFAVALSLVSCLVGAYFPARKAARQNPMEVLG